MGTSYSIILVDHLRSVELGKVKEAVEAELASLNAILSIWDSESEITRLNSLHSTAPIPVSVPLKRVISAALEISEQTVGAFDPTVKPLMDYWGFGKRDDLHTEKNNGRGGYTSLSLEKTMEWIGWEKVQLTHASVVKIDPKVQFDLSAIAKGYGVDAVAQVIRSLGFTHFLVEIGGEIVASGSNPDGKPWQIGIEWPGDDSVPGSNIFQTLELSEKALATSGDYRNFRFRTDGTRYSHLIDPRTGMPVESNIASVSVLADSCMKADAIATALFVMGLEESLQWLENQPDLEALFILHDPDQMFVTYSTPHFPK